MMTALALCEIIHKASGIHGKIAHTDQPNPDYPDHQFLLSAEKLSWSVIRKIFTI